MRSPSTARLHIGFVIIAAGFILAAASYLAVSASFAGIGFPLDDAWIHQTYARNLAQGDGWAFLPGQPSAGSTSPLWTVLLAVVYAAGIPPIAGTMLLGSLSLVGLGLACMRWFSRRVPSAAGLALWVLGAVMIEWHLVWAALSGMEILLFAFIVCFVLSAPAVPRSTPLQWGIVIGVGIWIRPEALTLLLPSLWVVLMREQSRSEKLHDGLRLAAGTLLGLIPYLGFNYAIDGSLWPSTFYAKQAEYAVLLERPLLLRILDQTRQPLTGMGVLVVPGLLWTTAASLRRRDWASLAPLLWVGAHLGAYALRLPVIYQHGRYSMPVIAVLLTLGIEGMVQLRERWPRAGGWHVVSRAWAWSVVAGGMAFLVLGARAYGTDVAVIQTEMVRTSTWIAGHADPESLIAAHDIGALGYYGGREILDLAGLISPDVIPILRDEQAIEALLNTEHVDYLMTFPGWYPELTEGRIPLYVSGGRYSPTQGGENMAVYTWP